MRKIWMLITVLSVGLISNAQTKTGKIMGTVIDGNSKTLESATIALLRAKDSGTVKFSVADRAGHFEFENVKSGKYLVSVTAVGHTKGFSEIIEIHDNNTSVTLKTIELVPVSKSIGGVTVTSKKPLIEQKIDRTVVNVEASVTNVGSTALEVLEKSPGITVDKDGNISLKGKQGVMVLIDGRPTQLGAADLANMLRSMNANQLDQIEIMTNPPAKYDAAGNAGIINIKTKKNVQFGYNGSITVGYGQGRDPKFNEAFNFNYRKNKVNWFANLSHNYRQNFEDLSIQRNFYNETSKLKTTSFDQLANMMNINRSYNAKLGLDYFANKRTSFGVVVTGFQNPGDFSNRNVSNKYDITGNLIEKSKSLSIQEETWKSFSTNLNFRRVLDTAGKELTADLDFISYDNSATQVLTSNYFKADGSPSKISDTLLGNLPQDIKIYSGRVDYLQPLKKGARFEAGLKSSIVRTDNNAIYDTTDAGVIVRDRGRSNHFIYEEMINAAYVNFSTPLSKKINAQFGLRLENTIADGHSTGFVYRNNQWQGFDSSFERNYTQLFPTVFFQYKANEKNNFGMNYGRRIRRPNYESLNPFIEFLDLYTYQQGNPSLKPQFSHNIELSHTYRGFLTTTLNYTRTTDIIQDVIEQIDEGTKTYLKKSNIANQRQYGISVNAGVPLTKWWTSNLFVNVFNNYFSGMVNKEFVTISATSLMLNGSQQFKINKTLTGEISGFFRTAGIEGVIKAKSMGMLAAGLSQQMLKGKATLRLNVRDILYTQGFRAETKYGTVDAAFQNWRDSRVINLGFTYRFNKGKMSNTPKKRINGSASDEQNRVGGGNGN